MATRRERVVLELEDRFTPGTAKAAAQSELLARHLDRLDKGAVRAQRSLDDTGDSGDNLSVAFRNGSKDIDRFSGRLAVLGKIAATLGPALIPIGALGVPAVAGLASALGFSAIAAGTAVLAFQGVGEALDKVNKAALEPTEKNLQDARDAMAALSPAARDLVDQLHDMVPAFRALRDTAAAGLFPGLVDGLQHLEAALPRVERVIGAITTELGDIASDAGRSLASDRWAPFLDFIGDEAPEALADLASAAGDTAHGLAELWMAFDPLNDDFTRWVRRAADDFDRWASQLSQTQGFAEFVDYIREVGPQVGDTLSAVGNALLQIAEAAAPLGGPTLHIIEALAKAIAAIADSDLGTPIFALISAGVAAKSIANLAGSVGRLGKETLTTEKGLSRFVGFLGGPWGIALTAAGLGLGMFLKSQAEAKARVDALRESLDQQTGAITDNTREAAARALESQGALQAAEQLGIGLDTLTDAALGNDAAMASVKDRIKAVGDQMEQGLVPNTVKTREAVQKLKHGITQGNGELREATAEQRRVAKAAGATSKQLDHQRAAQEKLRQATNAAREAARKEGAQWLAFGDNLDDTKVSLDSWIKSLQEQADALNNFT
ncbi:MAG TPA: hypothetical protein VFO98_05995, partial [Marmoricola sp.]|nr:hypothetical protein [Marmoricola sp.]